MRLLFFDSMLPFPVYQSLLMAQTLFSSQPDAALPLKSFLASPPEHSFFAVIGSPVGHSKSPLIHNIALCKHAVRARYYAIDTPANAFAWIGRLLSHSGFRGLNITIPHKSRIMDVLDSVDPLAQEVGAVNTVHQHRTGFVGYNTDVAGFVKALEPHALLYTGQTAVVLGSGGAARAAVAACRELRLEQAIVVSRNPQNAAGWPAVLNRIPVKVVSYDQLEASLHQAALIINTTPLGMYPKTGTSAIPPQAGHLLEGKVCMDAIYNPLETHFMKQARHNKAYAVVNGLEMFIEQAAAAFNIWTGKSFPREDARDAMRRQLQG